jgi:mono/diheme cytochrome c family protein
MNESPIWVRIGFLALALLSMVSMGRAQPQAAPPAAPALALGARLYGQNCSICHGRDGAGDGPATSFLNPKPRDFTKGIFKFRSTTDLPTDDDLFRTISRGVSGTLMPSFQYLPGRDRWALVAYVKTFSNVFQGRRPQSIVIPEPPAESPALLAKGQQLYSKLACSACHGAEGRGDGPAAAGMTDSWGNPIQPYNFTNPLDAMPGGSSLQDIYRTLKCGIGGTPMPSFAAIPDEDVWAEAYYIRSLAQPPPAAAAGDPRTGKELFIGSRRFVNGGPPCIGCHSIAGIGALGGGVMGPDLTVASEKLGSDRVAFILTTLPFPVMRPLFTSRPLAPEEQSDLAAFLQSVGVIRRPPGATLRLVFWALALAAILLLLAAFFWRRRLTEVRRPMVAKP